MHNLYKLTCDELEKLDRKAMNGDLSPAEFERMSDLIETKKDMLKIGEMEDMGGSFARGGNRGGSYNMGGSYEGRYEGSYGDMSYARGDGRGRGSQANRDSRGRYSSERGYSRDDEFMSMYEGMPEHKKNELMRIAKEM
jgi:hypothetical protein